MKMKFNKTSLETAISKMRPKDIVSVKTVWADSMSRYLVIRVSKKLKSIDLLPLEEFYMDQKKQEAPILSVPFSMIKDLTLIDKGDLLFLANHKNPHIINALEAMQ